MNEQIIDPFVGRDVVIDRLNELVLAHFDNQLTRDELEREVSALEVKHGLRIILPDLIELSEIYRLIVVT